MAAGHLAIDWTPLVWKYGRSKVRLWLIKVGLRLYCQFWDSYIVSIREGWTFNYCCVLLASQVEIVQSSFVFPISIALNIPSYLNSFCSLLSLLYSPTYAVVFLPNIIFFKCQVHVWHFGCMNSLIIQVEIGVSGAFYYLAVFCSIY